MKIKIVKVYKKNDTLYVETDSKYGKKRLGLSLDAAYLDPETNKPRYLKEVQFHLKRRYDKELNKEVEVKDDCVGKEFELDDMDKSTCVGKKIDLGKVE